MTNVAQEWTEEERAEKIAEALKAFGLDASAQDTGGGIVCIVVPRGGGEISWGTADVTWGAVITDEEGLQVSSISTNWPSDSEDITGTAKCLLESSLNAGAVQARA